MKALKYNQKPFIYDIVDDLSDLGGNTSQEVIDLLKKEGNLIISKEENFVKNCKSEKYDFLVSDCDHENSGKWVDDIYRIVKPNGIIFAHDVISDGFPLLRNYITRAQELGYSYNLFDKSSRSDEICHKRGWLLVIKN